jgi:hypothetical protein
MSAFLAVIVLVLARQPVFPTNGIFCVPADMPAEIVHRNVNALGRSGTRSDGILREEVDDGLRFVTLRLLVPAHFDTEGELIRLTWALEDLPGVDEVTLGLGL